MLKVFIKGMPAGENEERARQGWESPQTMMSDLNEGKKEGGREDRNVAWRAVYGTLGEPRSQNQLS